MSLDYLLKITRGLKASDLWLKYLRGYPWVIEEKRSWYTHLRGYYHFFKRDSIATMVEKATLYGQSDFLLMIEHERKSK